MSAHPKVASIADCDFVCFVLYVVAIVADGSGLPVGLCTGLALLMLLTTQRNVIVHCKWYQEY